ncbi:MAG: choice-of-anchor D domain-containing protein [Acidobacteriaceae bacterium]
MGATEAALTLSSGSVAFGNVPVTTPITKTVILKSSGTAPLIIQSAAVSGTPAFTVSGVTFPRTLSPGQSATLVVKCYAAALGGRTGAITLLTNTASGKATITVTATVESAPGLTLSAASVAFGDVTVDVAKTEKVALKSSGSKPLTISSATLSGAGAFTMSGVKFPLTLNPGQSATLAIRCDPATSGARDATIKLATNAPNSSSTISLTATALAATPQLTLSAASIPFGDMAEAAAKTEKVTLTSTGVDPLTISSATQSGASAFTISGITFPLTLKAGQSATLTVKCDSPTAGSKTGTITLMTNAPNKSSTISLSATILTPPALALSTSSVEFGDVTMNTAVTKEVTLKSTGQTALTISSATRSGTPAFTLSGITLPLTLKPGASATLTIKCDALTAGLRTGTITLLTNASSKSSTISLTATILTPPALTLSASSVSFGDVSLNKPVTKAVTLKSTGQAALTISAGAVSGSAGFTLSGVSFPVTLDGGKSVTLTIECDATTAGAKAATAKLTTNAGTSTISLSATGEAGTTPALTLGSTSVSFGDVGLNTPATQSVMLTSSGNAAVTISGATATGTGFSVVGPTFPVTLQPGQTAALEIQFDPTTTGTETGTAMVTSNGSGGTPTVALSATGEDATTTQVDLNWDAPSNAADPATGYNIYRAVSTTTNYQLLNSTPETATTYQDMTAVAGTTYSYYVVSVDANGELSGPSNPFTVTVPK